MRVGVIGPAAPDHFADNILSTLPRLGHEAVTLGAILPQSSSAAIRGAFAVASRSVWATQIWERRIVTAAAKEHLDLIITVQGNLLPDTVAALRKGGTAVVLWFPDHVANIGRQLMLIAPYDAIFFKDPVLVDRLRDLAGLPVHYLPEACNPAWHRSAPRPEIDPVVVIAGNFYPSRAVLLERLHRAGVPLALYGAGWPRWIRNLSVQTLPLIGDLRRETKARVFRRSAAVLNNLHPAEMTSVNCRLFEAAGCGAVVLCEERPALAPLFEAGREVLTFSTFSELMDRIQGALINAGEMTKVGDAANLRAHRDHTYDLRLVEMFRATFGPSYADSKDSAQLLDRVS